MFQLRLLFVISLFMANTLLLSAQTLQGRVYIAGTETPIANASVYYNASTIGTVTNNSGGFELSEKADHIPLIVSCIGYTTAILSNYNAKTSIKIYLTPKVQFLHEVVIGSDGMSRKEKEKIFLKEFLGTSTFAKECTITNINVVELTYHKKAQTLIAECDTPLQIDNKLLGYHISYFLQKFAYSPSNTYFSGNCFYKDDFLPAEQDKIFKNRKIAYQGSRLQFIRALWFGRLKENGFKIYTAYRNLNTHTIGYKLFTEDSIIRIDSGRKFIDLKHKNLLIMYGTNSTDLRQSISPSFINNTGYYGTGLTWYGGNMSNQRIGDNLPYEYFPKDESYEDQSKGQSDYSLTPSTIVQTNLTDPKQATSNSLNTTETDGERVPLFFEKAFLHTDRDIYGQGEDIWFKAYIVNAQNNTPISYSHNLYVEFINPQAKIFRREMIRLENGVGNGDFKLSDTMRAGRYRIRAYTNWMRNFGDNFVFEKNITILQTAMPAATSNALKINKNKTSVSTPVNAPALPQIRFYPEGGALVQGISSFVGVKAEDANGKGIPAKGAVIAASGDTVAHFSCDSLGLGVLTLLPVSGQSYHAVVDHLDSFELPAALSKGLTLQIKQTDSVMHAFIKSSGQAPSAAVILTVKHGGKTQLNKQLTLQSQQTTVRISTAALPEGISAVTIYNSDHKPECERLVYVHHPENNHQNRISITTDKKSYQPKEKTSITIHVQPNSNLSLAVVDASTVPIQQENIVSYLNLQSEIKGNIESPNRYFDTTNVNRFKQLDLLLLTQGWRDFVWKRMEDTMLQISYQPEQGISITGRVRRVGANKPLPGINITMRAPRAEGQKLFWATTDSAGKFSIYDTKFYGYQYISFTSRKSDKINHEGDSKGNSGGYIQVDSLQNDTLPVHRVKPIISIDNSPLISSREDKAIERIRESLKLKADHNLKEVTIKAKQSRLVTKIPPEIHPITLVEQKEYDNLGQYLLYMVEGSRLGWNSGRVILVLIDGKWVRVPILVTYADGSKPDKYMDEELLSQPLSNILKVTINRMEDVYGKHISVNLVIRTGVLETKDYFDNTMADMVGYYKAREFYKPKAGKPDDIDLRTNTIHWEPNITTNEKGEATVSFYNAAQAGKMRLIIEGITPNGMPLAETAVYEVK